METGIVGSLANHFPRKDAQLMVPRRDIYIVMEWHLTIGNDTHLFSVG